MYSNQPTMGITQPSSSAYQPNRCGFCGVTHIGADGGSVVCPKLQPGYVSPPLERAPAVTFGVDAEIGHKLDQILALLTELMTVLKARPTNG